MKVHVVVETPRGSRNKYEWDEHERVMRLDRFVPGAVSFPADYGFIPDTRAVDGDPLDAIVLLQEPTFPGVWIKARPIGVCWIDAEKYCEPKVICVARDDPFGDEWRDISDLPKPTLDEITQFFDVYKDFDGGHGSHTEGFEGHKVASEVIRQARRALRGVS
jgi:inorganic pyrophosphatase